MSDRARRFWRIMAVVALAGIPFVVALINLATPFVPLTKFGFTAGRDGAITTVSPSSAASKAGLKPGDRFDVATLSPQERVYLNWAWVLAGTSAEFRLSKGPARSVTLVARTRSAPAHSTDTYFALYEFLVLSNIAVLLLSAALALAYPSRMAWAFLFYAAGSQLGSHFTALPSPPWVVAFSAYHGMLWFAMAPALIVFALRFPTNRVGGAGKIADRWLPWFAVAAAPLFIVANVALVYRGVDTSLFENSVTIVSTVLYCAAVAIFAARYITEGPEHRPRMAWVIASFLVGYGGIIIWSISDLVTSVPPNLALLLSALNVAVPIAVLYTISQQRVISVWYLVNKALIFATVVAIVIGLIVLLDSLTARRLEERFSGAGLATVVAVNAAAGLVLGFFLPRLYGATRDFVDRYFFRKQYRVRQQMLHLAERLAYADSKEQIDDVLVDSVVTTMEIGSVAIFVRGQDGAFHRKAARGWNQRNMLDHSDSQRLVRAFERSRRAVRLADLRPPIVRGVPRGDAAPTMGFPIFDQHSLSRFVLFSGHPYGLDLDPSEARLLWDVTRGASRGLAFLGQL
ncbi:MAG: hypothetical protein JO351_10415 [Candidatus Eremiobacteraeota bacterium]|nr:hypothetical protein [Candidatus Eremiobacteraeota bacterium]